MCKKFLSLLLILCMVVSSAPAALAASEGDGVRETDFLDDQNHADVNYEDMEIVDVTEEEFLAAIDVTRALIESGASNGDVLDAFHKVTDLLTALEADLTLLDIRKSADVYDEEAQTRYGELYGLYNDVYDPFIFLIQDILVSGCREDFIKTDRLTEDDVEYYETYGGMSEEEKALRDEIVQYQDDYSAAYGEEDIKTMTEMFLAVRDANLAYMEYVDDYDTYADYAYAEVYGRDYTVEDAEAFFEAVKMNIVPLIADFDTICIYDQAVAGKAGEEILNGDYTGGETLERIRPYIGRMSGELLEAWDYMTGHGLYDIAYSETKDGSGFTTMISGYGAPFFFNTAAGDIFDFTTIVHEFGHYNNFFYHPDDWNEGACSYDVAEVHSQGLELLFTQFYDDIFGDQAELVEDYLIENILLSGILNGARMGELELYAYSSPDVTAEMIDEKFTELSEEYGLSAGMSWVEIPHLTNSPLYYISYATSAVGAFAFWMDAQEEGYEAATDKYLTFVSRPYYDEFQDEFADILGVNPMDPEYVGEIADALYDDLLIEERLNDITLFPDVDIANPSFSAYLRCFANGVINGCEDGLYHPERSATRAEAIQAFYNLLSQLLPDQGQKSSFTDVSGTWYETAADFCASYGIVNGYYNEKGELVFDGDVPITREELSVILYRSLGLFMEELDTTPASFSAPVSPWAADAMNALANIGMLNTATDPKRIENRETLVGFINNLLVQFI